MYPQRRMVSQSLRLALLATLLVLALSACGGNEQVSKPQPLPEEEQQLRTGVYRSEEFKPSLTFRVGEGWKNVPVEAPDVLHIERQEEWGGWLAFTNVQLVFKPGDVENVVEAPKDMVGWFQHHPYLQTDKPETISVGGVKGVQFDVVVKDLPKGYYGDCGLDCVDLFETGNAYNYALWTREEGEHPAEKQRVIVLEGVKGETVTIIYTRAAPEFDEFAPEAQRVLESVEWTGS
jgi:hypothetical protein